MFKWLRTEQKPNARFLAEFERWFNEKYKREEWQPDDIKRMQYVAELWYLKGQHAEMESRDSWF